MSVADGVTESATAAPAELLREAGLRVTSQRLAVLAALAEGHVDVETLTARARARLGTLSSQAVYEMLQRFVEVELVRRFHPPTGPIVFELDMDAHDHAVCTACGRIENVPATSRRPPVPRTCPVCLPRA